MNELKLIDDFRAVLADYHISDAARKTLEQTTLVLLVGVSGCGRNTIINELVKGGHFHFVVSDTTRQRRMNDGVMEQDGKEYWFRTEEEVLQDLRDGKYLEAEIIHGQQASGISVRELEQAHREGRIAITDVDIGGVSNVLQTKPDTIALMILPPSFGEWQRRINKRGEMPPVEFRRRLETAARIFARAETDEFMLVINSFVEEGATKVDAIARQHSSNEADQEAGRKLARELRLETEALLATL
jgi:guanylate kinase